MLELAAGEAELLNDDRVGRILDQFFDSDRASLITTTVLGVVREFSIATDQLHNDSTTVTVTGDYPDAEADSGGKPIPAICHGHNKDFRPDLKQLMFILTISADGAVPIAYRVADGNTPATSPISRSGANCATWSARGDLYVADSKLRSKQAMGHIHARGVRFVMIVPRGRREDTWFRDWAQTHAPAWIEARRGPRRPAEDPAREAPAPSVDGCRVIRVHSSSRAARDASARAARIEAGLDAIDTVAARLSSPKTQIKTRVAAEAAATTALAAAVATRWVGFTIGETTEVDHRQENRGRSGATTRYRRTEKTVFTITARHPGRRRWPTTRPLTARFRSSPTTPT